MIFHWHLFNYERMLCNFLAFDSVYRQPPSVRLFPSAPGFVAVSEAVIAGVSCSCLLVATQAAQAATALFRYTQTHML